MTVKNRFELEGLKAIGRVVALVLNSMVKKCEAGMTTLELDRIGAKILTDYRANSAPMKCYRFPGYTCISINHEVAHGIPSTRKIRNGDLINIDVSAELNGFYADTGKSFIVGNALSPSTPLERPSQINQLCECAKDSLYQALSGIKSGEKINRVGWTIQEHARKQGFTTIKNLTGHGTGRRLHEPPDEILNYYEPRQKAVFTNGMVVAVETFISTGAEIVNQASDGWTLLTRDGSYVAQHEHTIVVTDHKPIIITKV